MINEQQKHYINTLKGKIDINDLGQSLLILPHEHLFQNLSYLSTSNLQINLQTINQIRSCQTLSMENLVLNDPNEIAHELSFNQKPIFIIESTNEINGLDIEKLKQLNNMISKMIIIIGYSIPKIKEDEMNSILYSKDNIQKKLEIDISMSINGAKPAFFGEIIISQFKYDLVSYNFLECFFYFSNRIGIPIIFDLEYGLDNYKNFIEISNKYLRIYPGSKIIICNPFIDFEENIRNCDNQYISMEIKILNLKMLTQMLDRQYSYIVLDVSTFGQKGLLPSLVENLIRQGYDQQIFISPGVKYRSHLQKNGGDGYTNSLLQNINQQYYKLFGWASQIIIQQEQKKWNCPVCKLDYNDDIQKFKKFEQEFCSIKCLRQAIKK